LRKQRKLHCLRGLFSRLLLRWLHTQFPQAQRTRQICTISQYCEVLLQVPNSLSGLPIFNTTGYNSCPNYSTLTGQSIIDSYNATYFPGNPYGMPSGATDFILDWPRNWIFNQGFSEPTGTTQYLVLDVPEPNVPVTTFGFAGFNTDISGLAYVRRA